MSRMKGRSDVTRNGMSSGICIRTKIFFDEIVWNKDDEWTRCDIDIGALIFIPSPEYSSHEN